MITKLPNVYTWIEKRDGEEMHLVDSIHSVEALKKYVRFTSIERHDLIESNKILMFDLAKREEQLMKALKENYELQKELSRLKGEW